MAARGRRLLVVLTGPVGGGKSTVALRLAERLRTGLSGHEQSRVGVVDLDLVADMVRPHAHYGEEDLWQMARRICGGLADAIYAAGHDTVVVEGEFFTPAELKALQRMNEQFTAALPWLQEVGAVFDANEATAEQLAEVIGAQLFAGGAAPPVSTVHSSAGKRPGG